MLALERHPVIPSRSQTVTTRFSVGKQPANLVMPFLCDTVRFERHTRRVIARTAPNKKLVELLPLGVVQAGDRGQCEVVAQVVIQFEAAQHYV